MNGIIRYGVTVTQIIKEGGEGGEALANRIGTEAAAFEVIAPGDDMGTGDEAELIGLGDVEKSSEVLYCLLVGAAGLWGVEVGEPFELERDFGEVLEGWGGEEGKGLGHVGF